MDKRDSTVKKMLVLHATSLSSISGTIYDPSSPTRGDLCVGTVPNYAHVEC